MTKHHHQSKAEQIYNKAHGAAPFHHKKMHNEKNKFARSENTMTVKDSALRLQTSNSK